MNGIPISMRTAGPCYICGCITHGWLVFCECGCGAKHGVCMECLNAARRIGLVWSRIVEMEHDVEHGGKLTMKFDESTFKRCPSSEEVRMALAIGR